MPRPARVFSLLNSRLARLTWTTLLAAFSLPLSIASAHAAAGPDFPPAAELRYTISARQSGLPLSGSATLRWTQDGKSYRVHSETRAILVGKILDTESQGHIDAAGLAPEQFVEKRLGKDPTTTTFERSSQLIRFSASPAQFPLSAGAQDRSSATWQLVALIRSEGRLHAGQSWEMQVAGRRDAESWVFKVTGQETVRTPLGDVLCWHIVKAPPQDAPGQQLDVWLAPQWNGYPARLRFADTDGNLVDQWLEKITPLDTPK